MESQFKPEKIGLIIGLGNPGKEYQNTYHNVGHLFADFLDKTDWTNRTYKSYKSSTFMNQSGRFVNAALKKHGLKPENLLVVHDDSDITLGSYKLHFGRGAAGHKGIESVIQTLKTKKIWRLRIGIRPISPMGPIGRIRRPKADEFVLKKIKPADKEVLQTVFSNSLKKMRAES